MFFTHNLYLSTTVIILNLGVVICVTVNLLKIFYTRISVFLFIAVTVRAAITI